ncbi:N-acetylmuramoyl-L-alanine amidase [uncultured Pseudacidovorax sp.]|uniref:N-acetylmuramoyl-L-alanine amidase n=1 Tax=uncultured Pseudacidovorax sp. TaxID=679313 RepID=UPI0025CEA253|nr:N-acetylmuramoyl-L-alanine amidase [uncultured Pseudacidovorax sp.]
MGYENVGKVWSTNSFAQYLRTLERPAWCKAVTLHHTGSPSLADRPKGLLVQHIHNLQHFYAEDKGWSAGPHLFIDEDEIFGMSYLRKPGVHAVSFNRLAIGIEVLGNYDVEDPLSGRGLACWKTAAAAASALMDWLQLTPTADTVLFHRDDPQTTKKCPGRKVEKAWVLELIAQSGQVPAAAPPNPPDPGFAWNQWQYTAGRWCVPVHDFLVASGRPSAEVRDKLRSVAGEFFYGSEPLEGAYYVKAAQKTWAPLQEVVEVAAP